MRYLVFTGDNYYPLGGAEDYSNCSDSLEDAKDMALRSISEYTWANVFDVEKKKCVFRCWFNHEASYE